MWGEPCEEICSSSVIRTLAASRIPPVCNAITFNSLIDDCKLAVMLNYPSEVKRGTCFNVVDQKVISGRRITIPKKLAELMGVDVGDQVELGVIGDALMVRKYRKPADGQPPAEPDGPSRRS
jgi:hypothetical protein